MKQKLIPFYRELDKEQLGYTLLLDERSQQVYRVDHKRVNQYKFWIAWAIAIALLRGIKDIHLSMSKPINILIVLFLVAISAFVGVYKYRGMYKDKREVYFTHERIMEYISEAKSMFKKEVKTAVVIFLIFIILIVLFFIYQWLIWLFFALILFGTFIYTMCGLPIKRFKLYKKRMVMDIQDFVWDSNSVKWKYAGKEISLKLPHINFANLDNGQNCIYVVSGENFSENHIYYLSPEGKKVFEYDKTTGEMSWEYKQKVIKVSCDHIESARLFIEDKVVLVITSNEVRNRELTGFNLNGTLLFEKITSPDYQLLYLASVDDSPSVVIEGNDKHIDSYGRNTWHCNVDLKTGKLIKSHLAY